MLFYHLTSQLQLNLTLSITYLFFWLMKVLWASFIRHSSHRGWKFQQKTCHSLALAILCWFEGQTTPLKMINNQLRFLFLNQICTKNGVKIRKTRFGQSCSFRFIALCMLYLCVWLFSIFYQMPESILDYVMDSSFDGASCITLNQLSVLTYM